MNFRELLEHQAQRQAKVMNTPNPISKGWSKLHFAINMLQMVMVECAETLQLLPSKYWKKYEPEKIDRDKVIEEWIDILLIWSNFAFYFDVTYEEFEYHLKKKMQFNLTRSDHAANTFDSEGKRIFHTQFGTFEKKYNIPPETPEMRVNHELFGTFEKEYNIQFSEGDLDTSSSDDKMDATTYKKKLVQKMPIPMSIEQPEEHGLSMCTNRKCVPPFTFNNLNTTPRQDEKL